MYKRISLLLLLLLLLLPIVSCGSEKNEPQPAVVETTAEDIDKEETKDQETIKTDEDENKEEGESEQAGSDSNFTVPEEGVRPIAVMIDNEGTRSLPQGGLDKAQIIYEVIVEGGETRLMPVFWGTNPEMIGPVRSSRDYFLDYSMEHDAIYVHFGWSPKAKEDISKLKINNINGLYVGTDVIWDLTKDKGNWQDSYTSMEKLLAYATKVKYRLTTDRKFIFQYNQSDVVPEAGQTAVKISLRYSSAYTSSYEYDSSTGLYNRFRKGKPHMERVSGKQLTAKNIIIQYTPNYDIKGDNKGRQEMKTTGTGNGYYITGGKAIKIKWQKESRSAQTKYFDESGNEIKPNKGQTWIQIVPLTSKITIE